MTATIGGLQRARIESTGASVRDERSRLASYGAPPRTGAKLAHLESVNRVLIVHRGVVDAEALRERCSEASSGVAGPHAVAVCHVLEASRDAPAAALAAQQTITKALRWGLGPAAEEVAVFVASDQPGDRVEDCAEAWGATIVKT